MTDVTLPRFLPDDLTLEEVAEEVQANETHALVTVRKAHENGYRRRIHLVPIDGGPSAVLTEGSSPRWIPPAETLGSAPARDEPRAALTGKVSFLHDGRLWAIVPNVGSTPELVAELEDGPITGYEWSPDGRTLAFRVLTHSAPYNASYADDGTLIRTTQTRANEISDDRGHHGSLRHQLFVAWRDVSNWPHFADLTSHLHGEGEHRPGNRDIGLFAWAPDSTEIAFTANFDADADQHAGQHAYLTSLNHIYNYDPLDHDQQISPVPPQKLTDTPRLISSLGWQGESTLLMTSPGAGREELPGAHNTLVSLAFSRQGVSTLAFASTEANVGITPLFGAGTHQGGSPRFIPNSVPINAPEGWDPSARVYYQANTGAGSVILRRDRPTYIGEPSYHLPLTVSPFHSPEVVFADPARSVRSFAVVPKPLVLDDEKRVRVNDRVLALTTSGLRPSELVDVTPGRPPRSLLELPSPLGDRAKPRLKTVSIPGPEGRPIPAVLYLPPLEFAEADAPGILYLKGGPHTLIAENSYVPEPLFLASLGYPVVAPNLTASDLGNEEESMSLLGHWGELDVADAKRVLAWMRTPNNSEVSIDRFNIGMIGMSAGAHTAVSLLTNDRGFSCVGIERGAIGMGTKYWAADDPFYSESQFSSYEKARRQEDQILQRLTEAGRKVPMSFLQGELDLRTPRNQSWMPFNRLRFLPGDELGRRRHERHSFARGNHMIGFTGNPADRRDYYWTMLAFMHNHLTRARQGLPELSPEELRAELTREAVRQPPRWSSPYGLGGTRATPRVSPVHVADGPRPRR